MKSCFSAYPATFELDRGGRYVIRFRDLQGADAEGDSLDEAVSKVKDALVSAMKSYAARGLMIPAASEALPGEELVRLPPSLVAKVFLLNHMMQGGVRPGDLAERMGVRPQEVSRITDLSHNSKIDTVARALEAVGQRLELTVSPARR